MAHAIVFDTSGRVVEPSAVLRKRPLLIERGRFDTIEPFHAAMILSSMRPVRNYSSVRCWKS